MIIGSSGVDLQNITGFDDPDKPVVFGSDILIKRG